MKDGSTLQLSNRKKYLDTVIRQKTISLKSAPKEKLRCSARKGGRSFEYYQVTDSSGRNGIYIPNASHALAKELAQKSMTAVFWRQQ